MSSTVLITAEAERDLWELYLYVAANDAPERAEQLLEAIEKEINSLDTLPSRGHFPPELARIGVLEFREIFYKPYRIIYEISGDQVFVHCVLDGRRDLADLLHDRLLR